MAWKGEAPSRQVAKDVGISETCLQRWLRVTNRDDERAPAKEARSGKGAELREAQKRIRLLEQESENLRRESASLS